MFKFWQQQSQPQVPPFIQDILNRSWDKVEQDIQVAQANKRTKENLFWDMETFMRDNPWVNDEEAYKVVLDVYRERGWTIEWVDIDQELQALWWTQPMQPQMQTQMQPQEEKQGFLSRLNTIPEGVPFVWWEKIFDPWFEGKFNLPLWMATQVPSAISNLAWGTIWWVDKLTEWSAFRNLTRAWIDKLFTAAWRDPSKLPENLLQDLSQSIIQDWVDTKEKLQKALWVDHDAFMTKTGEFITNVWGSIAIPVGPAGSVSKTPQIVQTGLANLKTKAPKLYNILTSPILPSAWRWAVEAVKFDMVSEWEPSVMNMALWAWLNSVFTKIWTLLSTPKMQEVKRIALDRMWKLATKLHPSRTTKLITDNEISKATKWIMLIRETNPWLKIFWDEAVSNSLRASTNTRKQLLREMEAERWLWWVDLRPVIEWIDKMKLSLQNDSARRKFIRNKNVRAEFKELSKLDSQDVIKVLNNMKTELLSPAKSKLWKLWLNQLDDLIAWNNSLLWDLFQKAIWIKEKSSLKVRWAINKQLIKLLDKSVRWSWRKFRELKRNYWNVRTYEDNLNKIYAQLLRRKDTWLWDYADVFILSNMGQAIVTWDVTWLTKSLLQKTIKEYIKKQNDPNFIVETLFNKVDELLWIPPTWVIETTKRGVRAIWDKMPNRASEIWTVWTIWVWQNIFWD